MLAECPTCHKEFKPKHKLKGCKTTYCSIKCRSVESMGCYKYWLGKKRDAATKLKQSLSTRGPKSYKWKGNRKVDFEGYVRVYTPEHPFCNHRGFVREHRLVSEKMLKRYLLKTEEPHHINKNKQDNNPRNLIVFKSKSAHRRFEFGKSFVSENEISFDGRKLCQYQS